MKNNFTDTEIAKIVNVFSNKLNIRINRAGNIDFINPNSTNKYEHFVLYFTPNGRYLWRRWCSKYYCYPLNMRNRYRIGEIHRSEWGNWYQRHFNIIDCEFDTVDEAIEYFKKYINKYHNINC